MVRGFEEHIQTLLHDVGVLVNTVPLVTTYLAAGSGAYKKYLRHRFDIFLCH